MLNVNVITQGIALFLFAIALISIVVSVVTEVTKNTSFLNKIPTELEVLVLSIVFSEIALFALSEIVKFKIYWYYVVAVLILGFFVSFVIMFGWEKLIAIIEKCKTPASLRETYKLTYEEKKELNNMIYDNHNESSPH